MKCIALLLMLSTVLAGCASSQVPVKAVSKLAQEVSQGTGFLVRSDGLVLTAFHVVEGGNTIKVRCQGYDLVTAKRGERSQHLDLAVPPWVSRPPGTWVPSPSSPAEPSAR